MKCATLLLAISMLLDLGTLSPEGPVASAYPANPPGSSSPPPSTRPSYMDSASISRMNSPMGRPAITSSSHGRNSLSIAPFHQRLSNPISYQGLSAASQKITLSKTLSNPASRPLASSSPQKVTPAASANEAHEHGSGQDKLHRSSSASTVHPHIPETPHEEMGYNKGVSSHDLNHPYTNSQEILPEYGGSSSAHSLSHPRQKASSGNKESNSSQLPPSAKQEIKYASNPPAPAPVVLPIPDDSSSTDSPQEISPSPTASLKVNPTILTSPQTEVKEKEVERSRKERPGPQIAPKEGEVSLGEFESPSLSASEIGWSRPPPDGPLNGVRNEGSSSKPRSSNDQDDFKDFSNSKGRSGGIDELDEEMSEMDSLSGDSTHFSDISSTVDGNSVGLGADSNGNNATLLFGEGEMNSTVLANSTFAESDLLTMQNSLDNSPESSGNTSASSNGTSTFWDDWGSVNQPPMNYTVPTKTSSILPSPKHLSK
ncbi:hypothetical protein BJ684DRAFT_16236 [Piptocephalis cylindrospora]|uniref:Uncharacterized protein n=1 Tax=Piptocephalis cylindrospora TaxID=1907219 RepID=A0A4P9Y5A4_9FUNG|nr:hypothetical protein BJ684DRAFT_16236 [Piptocephalis cylindrospora]|eukprot:RKP13361.1 hypothetical protein BJ684DRAFT_16236 [Piptocephalis cylindrospora]